MKFFMMTKKTVSFLLILFLCCLSNIYSIEVKPSWTIGTINIGRNFGTDGNNLPMGASLLDFNFWDVDSGFGLTVSPVALYTYANVPESQDQYMVSFLNASLFYDFLKRNSTFQLGPYIAANYLSLSGFKDFKAEAGMQFSMYPMNCVAFPSSKFPLQPKICSIRIECFPKSCCHSRNIYFLCSYLIVFFA